MSMKKEKAEPRQIYSIRLNALERELIENNAKNNDMKLSDYIRMSAISGDKYSPDKRYDRRELLNGIGRIGNNINQIARWANTNKYISEEKVDEVYNLLTDLYDFISEIAKE